MDQEAWGATSMEQQRVRQNWSDWACKQAGITRNISFFDLKNFLMWNIFFKSLLNFFIILLLFYLLFCFWSRGMWDLTSLIRDQTFTSCIGRHSLNHWTTREIPTRTFLKSLSCIHFLSLLLTTSGYFHIRPQCKEERRVKQIGSKEGCQDFSCFAYPLLDREQHFKSLLFLCVFLTCDTIEDCGCSGLLALTPPPLSSTLGWPFQHCFLFSFSAQF